MGKDGMITPVLESKLLRALKDFDRSLRNSPQWLNWENQPENKYVIEQEGLLYPMRQVIIMATGEDIGSVGETEIRQYLASRKIRTAMLTEALENLVIPPVKSSSKSKSRTKVSTARSKEPHVKP